MLGLDAPAVAKLATIVGWAREERGHPIGAYEYSITVGTLEASLAAGNEAASTPCSACPW